jgi:hypothetical protein
LEAKGRIVLSESKVKVKIEGVQEFRRFHRDGEGPPLADRAINDYSHAGASVNLVARVPARRPIHCRLIIRSWGLNRLN